MDELERMIFLTNLLWYGGLIAPVVAGIVMLIVARLDQPNRLRWGLLGIVITFFLGAAGSFVAGESVLGVIMGSGDIPYHLVAQGWHRMWYPLGLSIVIGTVLAMYCLLEHRTAV